MSSFKSRVSCTFSGCIFQSKNIISWYPLFFVSALHFEGSLIPICGIQFLSCRSYVNLLYVPWKGKFLSSLMWPWCFSSSAWCAKSGKTWKFTSFLFIPSSCVKFSRLCSFLQSWGLWCSNLSYYFDRKICGLVGFYVGVNLYPVNVVDRAFEYSVATIFVVSMACGGSDSHCVTWIIAYLCTVFCSFSSKS